MSNDEAEKILAKAQRGEHAAAPSSRTFMLIGAPTRCRPSSGTPPMAYWLFRGTAHEEAAYH